MESRIRASSGTAGREFFFKKNIKRPLYRGGAPSGLWHSSCFKDKGLTICSDLQKRLFQIRILTFSYPNTACGF